MKNLFLILFIALGSNAYTQNVECGTEINGHNSPEAGGGGPGVPGGGSGPGVPGGGSGPGIPGGGSIPPIIYTMDCSNTSDTYINHFRTPQHWMPDVNNNTPIKTVKVNFIICQGPNGNELHSGNNAYQDLVDGVNNYYANSLPKGYPSTCEISYTAPIVDSKIRIELKSIYYVNDSIMYTQGDSTHTYGSVYSLNYIHNMIPTSKDVFNVFFISRSARYPGRFISDRFIDDGWHSMIYTRGPSNAFGVRHPHKIAHMAHEFGHAFGLRHIYNTEKTDTSHIDFLGDVFGGCTEPAMMDSTNPCYIVIDSNGVQSYSSPCIPNPGHVCYLKASCFFDSFPGPNPLMSGRMPNRYISPAQMGRFHRPFSLYNLGYDTTTRSHNSRSIHKYVKEDHSYYLPYNITFDQTWDFSIKMYQDIVVKTGNTLTIKCNVLMPIDGKIIVEQGAKLIVETGHITCAYDDELWKGIEVWGNSNLPQFPQNQGYLIVKDGALIENAYIAVTTWKPGNWNTNGGIVRTSDSKFLNNRKAIEFRSYQRTANSGQIIYDNLSYFKNTEFIWDDDLRANDPLNHITMYKVHGVSRVY